jgi:hypothetical protein
VKTGAHWPIEAPVTEFNIGKKLMASPFQFKQYGQSGAWVSELFPHLSRCVDDLTFIRSIHHDHSNHTAAAYFSHTGHNIPGRRSMGSWLTYGLGSECKSLPGFVVLDNGMGPSGGSANWSCDFLSAAFQGTVFSKNAVPVDFLQPLEKNSADQRAKLDAIRHINQGRAAALGGDSRIDALIANYEMAFLMQSSVPEVSDLSSESAATRAMYGLDKEETQIFGSRCLIARRLVERGVRFIEVFPPNLNIDRWDQHEQLEPRHRKNALAVDQPIAAQMTDLKARGLLDDTIVMWGGRIRAHAPCPRRHRPRSQPVWLHHLARRRRIQTGHPVR